jgi:DNA-binding Xre family transcriptional regulator
VSPGEKPGVLVLDVKRLRSLLALRGWTQGKLAKECGLSAWNMSRLMQGKAQLDLETAECFAKALGCTPEDFSDKYVRAT